MFTRIWQMVVKELIHVIRDKSTLFLLIGPPLLQTLILGYAATFEVRHLRTAVLDLDNTPESRELIARFSASPYFNLSYWLSDYRELSDRITRGDVVLALNIQSGFGNYLRRGKTAPMQVVLDGSN